MSDGQMKFHPVEEIRGSISDELKGKRILLGICYSSAIYRSIDVARHLIRLGADVIPVLTNNSAKIISPELFEWATGNKPVTSLTGQVEHITLAEASHGMVIAPATMKTMASIAYGYADNAVTTTAITMISDRKPVLIVPAMHKHLWFSPQCKDVISRLVNYGYSILPPVESGNRMVFPEPEYIARKMCELILRGEDLKGLRIAVTAGATREYIDEVRFISNPSSGRMGIAIALNAYFRGASVYLIHGHVEVPLPPWINSVEAISTEDMLTKLIDVIRKENVHALIMAAAPADFRPAPKFPGKIDSRISRLTLDLVPSTKIVRELRAMFRDIVIVGFAAEYVSSHDELIDKASKKLEEYDLDLVIANPINMPNIGFESKYNYVVIMSRNGFKAEFGPALKEVVARHILDYAKELIFNTYKSCATLP